MPNFAANLTMMYNESEFLDRFESAANSGFKGVEYLFPYSYEKNKLADLLMTRQIFSRSSSSFIFSFTGNTNEP